MLFSKDEWDDWLTVCFKYLLFVFNFLFWVRKLPVPSFPNPSDSPPTPTTHETSFPFELFLDLKSNQSEGQKGPNGPVKVTVWGQFESDAT